MAAKIFISYAPEDEGLLNRLKTHLMSLKRQEIIDIWYDRDISAGKELEKEISNNLNAAQIILLLISPDFMASDYLNGTEVKRAMERHDRDEARVIPILLRSSYWEYERYHELRASPVKEKKAVPVISSFWHNQDEAFVEVVKDIHKVAIELTRPCNVLFYNASEHKSEFYSIDSHGNKFLLKTCEWPEKWTHIIPGNFTGGKHTDLLLYNDSTGQAKFLQVGKYGKTEEIKDRPDCRAGWTGIIPGKFTDSAYTDLLFYSSAGKGEIYTLNGLGQIFLVKEYSGWQKVWTQIIPGKFFDSGYTDLLFYSNSTGQGQFYKTTSAGEMHSVKHHPDWYKDWSFIVSGKFALGKYTDLFIYNTSTGANEFFTTDGLGGISSLKKNLWSKGWTHIVPGNFTHGKYTDLLFHNSSTGLVKIKTTNGRGEVKDRKEHPNWQKHSTEVIYLLSI